MAEWYYAKQGKQFGPVSEEELIAIARSGAIKADDFVWTPGMDNWARAASIPRISLNLDTLSSLSSIEPAYAYGGAVQAGGVEYAGFWLRLVSYIIDMIVLFPVGIVIGIVIAPFLAVAATSPEGLPELTGGAQAVSNLISMATAWLYFSLCESSAWQATLGKKALGLKVVDMQGQRISFLRASGRHFAKIISAIILFIGFIMAGFTERKQALHDIIASCLVIRGR